MKNDDLRSAVPQFVTVCQSFSLGGICSTVVRFGLEARRHKIVILIVVNGGKT